MLEVAGLEHELHSLHSDISTSNGLLKQPVATTAQAPVSDESNPSMASNPTSSWPASAQSSLSNFSDSPGSTSLDQSPHQDVSRLLQVYMKDFAPLYPVV